MFKVVVAFNTPMPQEYMFIDKDKAIEFAKKYHNNVNNYVDINVYEESTLDNHIDAWLHNYFTIKYAKVYSIEADIPAEDYIPF